MLIKRYANPFGKFNWMTRNIPRFAKTVIKSGREMLLSMGVTQSIISEEMKEIMARGKAGLPLFTSKPKIVGNENEIIPLVKKETTPVKITI